MLSNDRLNEDVTNLKTFEDTLTEQAACHLEITFIGKGRILNANQTISRPTTAASYQQNLDS